MGTTGLSQPVGRSLGASGAAGAGSGHGRAFGGVTTRPTRSGQRFLGGPPLAARRRPRPVARYRHRRILRQATAVTAYPGSTVGGGSGAAGRHTGDRRCVAGERHHRLAVVRGAPTAGVPAVGRALGCGRHPRHRTARTAAHLLRGGRGFCRGASATSSRRRVRRAVRRPPGVGFGGRRAAGRLDSAGRRPPRADGHTVRPTVGHPARCGRARHGTGRHPGDGPDGGTGDRAGRRTGGRLGGRTGTHPPGGRSGVSRRPAARRGVRRAGVVTPDGTGRRTGIWRGGGWLLPASGARPGPGTGGHRSGGRSGATDVRGDSRRVRARGTGPGTIDRPGPGRLGDSPARRGGGRRASGRLHRHGTARRPRRATTGARRRDGPTGPHRHPTAGRNLPTRTRRTTTRHRRRNRPARPRRTTTGGHGRDGAAGRLRRRAADGGRDGTTGWHLAGELGAGRRVRCRRTVGAEIAPLLLGRAQVVDPAEVLTGRWFLRGGLGPAPAPAAALATPLVRAVLRSLRTRRSHC